MGTTSPGITHIGLSLGRVEHWHDGLGEFGRQLVGGIAARAQALRDEEGLRFHVHLPSRWHGMFGDAVGYLDTRGLQRWVHLERQPFALWHLFHQHNRYRPPIGTKRVLETVHDLNFLRQKTPAKARTYCGRMQRRLADRHAIVAISHFVADEIARELAPLATPIHVIHNGAADLSSAPREAVEGIEPTRYLLHVSRMVPSKNIAALLDLAQAWPEQAFVFAGGASNDTRDVERQIGARSLRNVRLVLDASEARKAWLYAHCRGFLFPSLTEGFGLPPIEAMHFGKPVFLSRLTSLPEVGGEVAFYFDGFEAQAMRATIEAGLRRMEAESSTAATIATHASRFGWVPCVQAYLARYRQLLASLAPLRENDDA